MALSFIGSRSVADSNIASAIAYLVGSGGEEYLTILAELAAGEKEAQAATGAAAERERAAARLRKGRSSTIVGGKRMSEPAILAKPTILGG